jgi:ribosomal protein S18 acetylase RimI-like enzyme
MQPYSIKGRGVMTMATGNKSKLTIRPMERGDINAAVTIYNKIRDEKIPGVKSSRLSYRVALTFHEIALTNPGGPLDLSLVAEVEGKVVGFIWSGMAHVGIPVDEVGIIYMLVVDSDYQKQGIAGKLVDALLERCRSKGVNTVRAVLDERHWELQNYFQKLGFRRSELAIYTKAAKD